MAQTFASLSVVLGLNAIAHAADMTVAEIEKLVRRSYQYMARPGRRRRQNS